MMIFSNRMNRFKRLFFILILNVFFTNLFLAQNKTSLQGTYMRTDTVKSEYVYTKVELNQLDQLKKLNKSLLRSTRAY